MTQAASKLAAFFIGFIFSIIEGS